MHLCQPSASDRQKGDEPDTACILSLFSQVMDKASLILNHKDLSYLLLENWASKIPLEQVELYCCYQLTWQIPQEQIFSLQYFIGSELSHWLETSEHRWWLFEYSLLSSTLVPAGHHSETGTWQGTGDVHEECPCYRPKGDRPAGY